MELVRYEVRGGVAWLTLEDPPVNGYSHEMMLALDRRILAARMDESVHVLVVTGAGDKFFCAGASIAKLQAMTPAFKYYFCLHANETLLRLEHTPKLTIAALNGHCVGGGLEVALACDFRLAKQDGGKIGLPEVALGVLPGTGGTQRLTRVLGPTRALDWMVTGKTCDFAEAERVGLVSRVLPAADFAAQVQAFAQQFCPPHKASAAVGAIKRSVQTGGALPLESGLALERELQAKLFASADCKIGLEAFLAKKPAAFTGQ
ncbi:MAG: enoyl-CoA hydratase/isomerase family protein [Planctomycetes bacterium]|nr:enoyl-CoA hydratase/isomerase family protein [Planctomycetota bacterium]